MNAIRRILRQYGIPVLILFFAVGAFAFHASMANAVAGGGDYGWDQEGDPQYYDVGPGCTWHSTCSASIYDCNAEKVGTHCAWDYCTYKGLTECNEGDPNNCGNAIHVVGVCVSRTPSCVPDSSCAANTYVGSTCTDPCGNAYAGTKPAACVADASCAASTPSDGTCTDACGNVYAGTAPASCTPDSSCVANTYVGNTCTDSCGNQYAGSKCFANFGDLCVSGANSCSMTNAGTYSCGGVCNATVPDDALCSGGGSCGSPIVSIEATPPRLWSGGTSTITLTMQNIHTSCVVTDQSGTTVRTITPGVCSAAPMMDTIITPLLTRQSTYSVSCDGGSATASIIVNLIPGFNAF